MAITTQRLKHVVALSEYRNFARAASALHITQPALSRSILALEQSLGATLFDRNPKALEPTVFGALVIRRASEILLRVSEMEREVTLLKGHEIGEVVIGAGPIVAASLIGRAIGHMSTAHPRIKVTLRIDRWDALSAKLQAGKYELFVGESEEAFASNAFEVIELIPRRVVFFARAGHPLAAKPVVSLADLQAYPLATPSIPTRIEEMLRMGNADNAWWGNYPQVPPAIECESYSVLKTIVAGCDALSAAPVTVIADELRDGVLAQLQVRSPDIHTHFGIVTLRGRALSPAAEAFISQLIEQDKASPN